MEDKNQLLQNRKEVKIYKKSTKLLKDLKCPQGTFIS